MMNAIIKELKCKSVFRRLLRSQRATYSQYRHRHNLLETFCWKKSNVFVTQCFNRRNTFHEKPVCAFFSSSSSIDAEDDNFGVEIELDDLYDHRVEAETENDLSHIRVKLYPEEKNDKLDRLCEAASVQQVFDIINEDGDTDLKVASQALVTIWDVQKLLFKISSNFVPERDFFDRPSFIEKISQHPTFVEKIVQPVVDNCTSLEDEPLLATLFCLQRMNFDIRGPECEKFIDECLRRQDRLSLPSVSRLCVCMRTESFYGNFIIAKFLPLLWSYVESMNTDLEVRLVAISLRNSFKLVSDLMMDKFRHRIIQLQADIPEWETVTLCKVFLLLLVCKDQGSECTEAFEIIGNALISRVPSMSLLDLMSLQKFLELGFLHPYQLVEALVQRMMRIVQEGISNSSVPRLDLLASIAPYMKTVQQRKQLTVILKDYMDKHNFELASNVLFTILRWSRTKDIKVYDQYWNKAADIVMQRENLKMFDRKILKVAKDYISFGVGLGFSYRNKDFEYTMKRYIYKLLENYSSRSHPVILFPGDFAKAFSFLIGLATFRDPIFYDLELVRTLDDFAPQLRPGDLSIIARGLDAVLMNLFYAKNPTPKYYDRVLEICSILEEQCSRILVDNQSKRSFADMLAIHKVALTTRKLKGDSPIISQAMQRTVRTEMRDSRAIKDLAMNLLPGLHNFPEANKIIASFIWNSRTDRISPDIIEKYVITAFSLGWDATEQRDVLQLCSDLLTKDWDKLSFLGLLQASLGLCFYRILSKEMVQNIFSVAFLDQIDAELSVSFNANQYSMKLRQAMMELNRSVCIDMPDVNLPWFHGKFCEEILTLTANQETYIHEEVRSALGNIVGDETAVQQNMCTPYYYNLDFLVEFDEQNRPVKRPRRQTPGFFRKFKGGSQEIKRKAAVLILPHSAFTRNFRDLRGQFKLRRRHLEILGYDVIELDPVHWNSMFMSENSVKHRFLESKLYADAC